VNIFRNFIVEREYTRLTMISIDADDGAVRVELPHGEAAVIEGLHPGVPVERGTQRALFLEPLEAETLGKMIDYILSKVPIRPESQDALRAVRPRLDELFRDATAE
jgi:hypothetical protein